MKNVSLGMDGLSRGLAYAWRHPHLVLLTVSQSLKQRVMIPLDALRWLVKSFLPKTLPVKKWQIRPHAPGVRLSADIEVMGSVVSVQVVVSVREVTISETSARIVIELAQASVRAAKDSPIAAMLDMVDLSKPGLLFSWLPSLPPFLVETADNHIVIDLWKLPAVQSRPFVQRLLKAVSHVVAIREVRVGNQAVLIQCKTYPKKIAQALQSLV